MKTNGILPYVALEKLNRGVVTHIDLIDANRLVITSSAGVFLVEGDTDKQGIKCLFWSEVDQALR